MRQISAAVGLGTLLLLAGCNSWPHLRGESSNGSAARVSAETPTRETLVEYLNRNARLIQSLEVC